MATDKIAKYNPRNVDESQAEKDLIDQLETKNTRISARLGDYESLESRAQFAEAALEVLKAKVARYFDMKALGHVNYFTKEDRKEFLELEDSIKELVK